MKRPVLGVMQGRLLPKYQGRYQAHPLGYWQSEFSLAAGLGLDLIEFILDFYDMAKNPLMHTSGLKEILALSEETGVAVRSVCADYFMEAPFHRTSDYNVRKGQEVLETLITNASRSGIHDIVIPCVDQSSFRGDADIERFTTHIQPALRLAEKVAVNLCLETDLPPQPFAALLNHIQSPRITIWDKAWLHR